MVEQPTSASAWPALPRAIRQIGFWSGLLYFLLSYVFFVGSLLGIAGILLPPWDVIVSIGASLLFAPILVALLACVYEATPHAEDLGAARSGLRAPLCRAGLDRVYHLAVRA